MADANEPRPLAMFSLNGVLKGRELADGAWMCLGDGGAPGRPGCAFEARTFHELLAHGQASHGWPKPSECEHPQFSAVVNVARVLDVGKFVAEVEVNCQVCGVPMRFVGVPAGFDYARPMVSITGELLHAPIEPAIETELHARASFTMPKIPARH